MIPAISEFSNEFPDVKVDVRDMDSRSVANAIASGFAEIGLASWLDHIRGAGNRQLLQDDFGLVCHARHPLAASTQPLTLSNLQPDQFISNDLCNAIDDSAVSQFLKHTRLSAQNTLSLIEFLNSGKWYTILPSSVVSISPQTIAFRKLEDLTAKRTISLLFRLEFEAVPYFARFLSIVENQAEKLRTVS